MVQATLFEVPFDKEDEWKAWMLDHSLQHDTIYIKMASLGKPFIKFPLTDANDPNDKDWMNNHQFEHEAIYALLGLVGMPDLASSDLDDKQQWQDWQQTHQDVHTYINNVLGI